MKIEASAPGKLILIGEYAVLFGAPAAVMAVDRRAVVTLESGSEPHWMIAAPGLTDRTARFEIGPDGLPLWSDPEFVAAHFGLVQEVLEELVASKAVSLSNLPSLAATLDTRLFFSHRDGVRYKLGLGSSAALTVALVTALAAIERNGITPAATREWLQTLVSVHRAIQGGRGSGVDVAASLLGGVVRFRLDEVGAVAEAERWDIPGNLFFRSVWTGSAASTGSFLERLEICRKADPGEVDRILSALGRLSEQGVEALAAADGVDFLSVVDAFSPMLDRLGRAIDMPILSEDHRLLLRIANRHGVSYKPSGAGGGDFGLAFSLDRTLLDGFCSEVEETGFGILDFGLDESGSTVTID